jgi:predicted unusual protein kinase regulating ubiquinone biosynthesis (AarF/ABC1/UbiB family)
LRTSGVEPVFRILLCGAASLLILAAAGARGLLEAPESRANRRRRALTRTVERWVRLLGELRGAYAKAGQFAASRPDLVPQEAAAALSTLRDRLPPLPPAEICRAVEAELEMPLEEAFGEFDPLPLGAASIAQVHRATLPDGTPVAVKVQYPWIQASVSADLKVLRTLARGLLRLRSNRRWMFDFERFFAEFAVGLADELDFEAEARAASEIAANLADDSSIQVPRVIASHTRTRVLTMTYSPCLNIGDSSGLANLGVQPSKVLEIVVRAYAKQIFQDGLFHADPHPGNLFVLDEPEASQNPRVLFVDFGLHRRLSPELQNEMRQGIFALMQRNVDLFVERMNALEMIAPGAELGVRKAVSQMLDRIASEGGSDALMNAPGSQVLSLKDEAKRLLEETPGLQLPNDLLLYAKTLAYVFALGEELDPNVDLMKISVPYLLQFLAARD